MFSASQFLAHLWGDYILQSDWMAQNKTKAFLPAMIHAIVYSLTFWLFHPSLAAWVVITFSHFLIDRYRLARYVVWAKNWMGAFRQWRRVTTNGSGSVWFDLLKHPAPESLEQISDTKFYAPTPPFSWCATTGYDPATPPWMSVWLLIIADNILHITINGLALKFL